MAPQLPFEVSNEGHAYSNAILGTSVAVLCSVVALLALPQVISAHYIQPVLRPVVTQALLQPSFHGPASLPSFPRSEPAITKLIERSANPEPQLLNSDSRAWSFMPMAICGTSLALLLSFLVKRFLPSSDVAVHQDPWCCASITEGEETTVSGIDTVNRRAVLHGGLAVLASELLPANSAEAWCGEEYPNWVFGVRFNDGLIPAPKGGQMYLRVLRTSGREKNQKAYPVLVIPGGPLISHDYMENLEALSCPPDLKGKYRRVIEYDPAGTGLGKEGVPASSISEAADEVSAALSVLQLTDQPVHIIAHGTGAAIALDLISSGKAKPGSLVLASPLVGSPIPRPPDGEDGHYAWGKPGSEFYNVRILGANEGTPALPVGTACVGTSILGPTPPTADVATLLNAVEKYDPKPALQGLKDSNIPVLVTHGGDNDLCDAQAAQDIADIVGAPVATFSNAAHLPHINAKEEYISYLLDFLSTAEPSRSERRKA